MQLEKTVDLNIDEWVKSAVNKYPQIVFVWMVGSRAGGWETEYSDFDLVVGLHEDFYNQETYQLDKIEQRIAFDPDLTNDALDIFWLRPDGGLGRWMFGPDKDIQELTQDWDEYSRGMAINGYPLGDFDRLRRSLRSAKMLFDIEHGFFEYPGAKIDWSD